MSVVVKRIERTNLMRKPYKKMVEKYTKNLKYNLKISFDKRLVCMGQYIFDDNKKLHIIKISPLKNKFHMRNDSLIRLGPAAQKYNIISTTMHELKHASQREELGTEYYSNVFNSVAGVSNPEISEWYSILEIEARIFEYENLYEAIHCYDSCCENIS